MPPRAVVSHDFWKLMRLSAVFATIERRLRGRESVYELSAIYQCKMSKQNGLMPTGAGWVQCVPVLTNE